MRNYIKILFLACLVAGMFAFHNRSGESNAFSYKGKIHVVQHAYIDYFTNSNSSAREYDIYLGSNSNQYHTSSINYINLNLNSNNASGIAPGTYYFNKNQQISPFTFSKGNVTIGKDNDRQESYYTTEGTVKVSKWGENHFIEYQLKLNNGEHLNGIFRGKIEQGKPS